MKSSSLVFALCLASALPIYAATNPWLGTWKLDPAKSHFTGATFTYSKAANGMMHYADGSTASYDFNIDGKEYPTQFGRTTSWTAAGPNAWDSVANYNGTVLEKTHRSLSADGKSLTMASSGTQPDGQTFNDASTWTRVAGTTGLEGKWKSTKVTISAPDSYAISAKGDMMHWDVPAYKESAEGKPDGSDMTLTGPTIPPGATLAYKPPRTSPCPTS